uniref:CusA/CzcA family heavy metal efflux RND transporter n=1 Tax=Hydrotalea sp. TaxID=2881279 RepID=UPI0026265F5D
LTYVPMMSAVLLSKNISHKITFADRIMSFLHRVYRPVILFALRRKAIIVVTSVALLVVSYLFFNQLGGEFIPTLQEGDFAIELRLQPGSSLSQTIKTTIDAGDILKKQFPEVQEVVSRIGVASIPTDPDPIETAMATVVLKDKSQWVSAANEAELADKMKQALLVIPGVNYEFSQPIQLRFNELLSGSRQDVAVKIYGDDLDMLAQLGTQAAAIISKVSGAQDVLAERTNGLPEITVAYNRDKIAQMGLSITEVNTALESAFAGAKAGIVYEGDRQFDLVIRFDEQHRKDLSNVQDLFISLPNGNQIPLSEVATVKYQEGPSLISRDNTKRRIAIGLNVRNRDVQSVVNDIQTQLSSQLKLPTGYLITYGGAFQNLIAAKQRLMIAVPVALALIFMLLFFTFGSIKESLLIFTAIPFAAIGGVFALLIRGMPFSISAGVGFIALFGVAVLNGIVLISFFNQLKKEGRTNINRRILEGVNVRLRPVVMTATVASLGFLPMAISASAGAEVQRPLATVVIGGLITSTLLTLIVLPVLYSIFMSNKKPKKIKDISNATGILLLLLVVCSPITGNAQLPVSSGFQPLQLSLDDAVKLALKNNQAIKSAEYGVSQQQALRKTAVDLNKTGFQYGFDNTILNGNKSIGVQQSFSLPTVYNRQGKLLNQQVGLSEKYLAISKADLIRNVKTAYYQLVYGHNYLKVLMYQDSIYKNFTNAANSRYRNGQTGYLEKVTAEATYQQIVLLRKQAQADIIIYEQELKKWIFTNEPVEPTMNQPERLPTPVLLDTLPIAENPILNYYQQNVNVATANLTLTKSRALPDFSVGLSKMGIGNSQQFLGYSVGINIPLWFKPYQGRNEAAKMAIKIAEADYANTVNTTRVAYNQQLQQYQKWDKQLNYYKSAGLKQSDEIIKNAGVNYSYGNISYIEYIQNLTQAFNIKLQYLNALNQYNQSIININYILGNN